MAFDLVELVFQFGQLFLVLLLRLDLHVFHNLERTERNAFAADRNQILRSGEEVQGVAGEIEVVVDGFGGGGAEEVEFADAIVVKQPVGVGDQQQRRLGHRRLQRGRSLGCGFSSGDRFFLIRLCLFYGPGRLGLGGRIRLGRRIGGQAGGKGAGKLPFDQGGEHFFAGRPDLASQFLRWGHADRHAHERAALRRRFEQRREREPRAVLQREAAGLHQQHGLELAGGQSRAVEVIFGDIEPDGIADDGARGDPADRHGLDRVAHDGLRIIDDAPALEKIGQVARDIGRGAAHHRHLISAGPEIARRGIDGQKQRLAGQEELVDGELELFREILRMNDGEHVEIRRQAVGRSLDGHDLEGLLPFADDHLALGRAPALHRHEVHRRLQRHPADQAELAAIEQLRLVQ